MKFEFEYQCDKEWDEMKGGDRRRFCGSCKKHVHHISGMTKEEALKFLDEHDWNVCVDFYRDDSGDTVFREAAKKLRMQNDGLKQLLASAAAIIPLALGAMLIDFDKEPTRQPALSYNTAPPDETPAPPAAPINLDGPAPVFAMPDGTGEPTVEPVELIQPAVVEIEPNHTEQQTIDVEPFVAEVDEPEIIPDVEPEPIVEPILHVRGRLRPPPDWRPDSKGASKDKPSASKGEFIF